MNWWLIIGLAIYNQYRIKREPPIYFNNIPGWKANTIPPFGIFINPNYKDDVVILEHEKRHWKQYQEVGLVGFYWSYAFHTLNSGYKNNPMEIDARKWSLKFKN